MSFLEMHLRQIYSSLATENVYMDSELTKYGDELVEASNSGSVVILGCAFFPLPFPLPFPLAGVVRACSGSTSSEIAGNSASRDSVS